MYFQNEKQVKYTPEKERKEKRKKRLEKLISKITPENKHKEISWGKPVGKEIW